MQILTGATGALGAHVLDQCAHDSRVRKVICLIRGEDEHAARGRIDKALEYRSLRPLKASSIEVEVVQVKLGDSRLDLEEEVYSRIAREATLIIHLAWEVNFRLNLRNFRGNSIAGKSLMLEVGHIHSLI